MTEKKIWLISASGWLLKTKEAMHVFRNIVGRL
jgi:hypothetical protein